VKMVISRTAECAQSTLGDLDVSRRGRVHVLWGASIAGKRSRPDGRYPYSTHPPSYHSKSSGDRKHSSVCLRHLWVPDRNFTGVKQQFPTTNLNEYARSSILDSGTKGSRSTAMRKNSISTTARFRRRLQISLAQELWGRSFFQNPAKNKSPTSISPFLKEVDCATLWTHRI
jgi:hypothetical protein